MSDMSKESGKRESKRLKKVEPDFDFSKLTVAEYNSCNELKIDPKILAIYPDGNFGIIPVYPRPV
jgi:hypothetical protein